ncbi:DUF2381 family protein [Archangium sp.]|uniref:DUF2381 family protein n=1 Tax=Archangium sp. TaxID=1872627 RepID=UPI00389A5DD3
MPVLSPATAVLLLLSNAPALAQPAAGAAWEMTGAPRFTVTADSPREVREIRISPNLVTTFVFDTPVGREGVIVEERGRFRQVSLSEDGLMLNLLPSGELPPGRRLTLTVRFADGAPPTSVDFTLVVSPQAETQVEVYRRPRPGDSYRQQAEQAEARLQQCEAERTRERTECGAPRGLIGLLAPKRMDEMGIRASRIIQDVILRRGEAFSPRDAVSYRATGGDKDAPVMRLAVALTLWNLGPRLWAPTHAQLVGQGGRWDAQVLFLEPTALDDSPRVLVEVELPGSDAPGPYLLKLWDESGTRTAMLSGVTFP